MQYTPNLPLPLSDSRNFFSNAAGYKLFMNERDSDVGIRVEWEGQTWHFPAHRLVLSVMSEVLRTMMETDMIEKSTKRITIKDCSPMTMKQFLKYLYVGAVEFVGWEDCTSLLRTAHKYGVHTLVTLCESQLVASIGMVNVCYLHEFAIDYSLPMLKIESFNFIMDSGFIVLATDGFLNLKPKTLELFLSSTKLNVENECTILNYLRDWAMMDCCRRCIPLTKTNILLSMKPFLKFIRWDMVPSELRTFIPDDIAVNEESVTIFPRRSFHVPVSMQYHVSVLKFVVELGVFRDMKPNEKCVLHCLKFGVDNHAFIAGFRIVGMFRINRPTSFGPTHLILGREDQRLCAQFNLNSLPWLKGAVDGEHIWREMVAYFPYPARVDPFGTYVISLKYGNRSEGVQTKWPCTRLESGTISSEYNPVNFTCHSSCYGVTQLFMLPAPPPRSMCNDIDEWD